MQTLHTDRTHDQPTRSSEVYTVVGLKRLSPGRLRIVSIVSAARYER
jgi:hypothetical protein